MANRIDIEALALSVQEKTALISKHWIQKQVEPPTLSSSSIDLTDDFVYQKLVSELISTTQALQLAIQGPKAFFQSFQLAQYDIPAWQLALEFRFFSVLPAVGDGSASVESFAQKTNTSPGTVLRVLRLLSLQSVFRELTDGTWAQTSLSRFLTEHENVQAMLATQMDEMYAASSSSAQAVKAELAGATTTPFEERFGTSIYKFYGEANNSSRSARFAQAMSGASLLDSASLLDMRASYPWNALESGTVVDIGGGQGQLSLVLSETNPQLNFLVEDIFPPPPDVVESSAAKRVQYTTHDFFTPQRAVPDARAYIMKHCLHNHPDDKVVDILRNIVPALESAPENVPLLIAEGVLCHERNLSTQERTVRRGDMCMWVTLGARERTQEDISDLLQKADARLKIMQIWGDGVTKLIEVKLVRH